jgi:DNA-binding response OmpR family regulator
MTGDRLLIVEDDGEIAGFLAQGLRNEGYAVDVASYGAGLHERLTEGAYRAIILDRMLPDAEGAEICRQLREDGDETMILMLTAKDTLVDKVDGLAAGADDYMTKPFAFEELLARLAALLRRAPAQPGHGSELVVGPLRLDLARKAAWRDDRPLDLTATEFALLHYLAEHAGAVRSRVDILKAVWGYDFDPHTNIVEVYIAYLRKKVDHGGEMKLIRNHRGFGYSLATN